MICPGNIFKNFVCRLLHLSCGEPGTGKPGLWIDGARHPEDPPGIGRDLFIEGKPFGLHPGDEISPDFPCHVFAGERIRVVIPVPVPADHMEPLAAGECDIFYRQVMIVTEIQQVQCVFPGLIESEKRERRPVDIEHDIG